MEQTALLKILGNELGECNNGICQKVGECKQDKDCDNVCLNEDTLMYYGCEEEKCVLRKVETRDNNVIEQLKDSEVIIKSPPEVRFSKAKCKYGGWPIYPKDFIPNKFAKGVIFVAGYLTTSVIQIRLTRTTNIPTGGRISRIIGTIYPSKNRDAVNRALSTFQVGVYPLTRFGSIDTKDKCEKEFTKIKELTDEE